MSRVVWDVVAELGIAEKFCIALGNACRRVFRFQPPDDVANPTYASAYFDYELRNAREGFWGGFAEPLDVRGKTVLEAGCGYGGMLVALREAGAAHVIGIDIDAKRVPKAAVLVGGAADVLVADVAALPLPSDSVDVVVSDAVFEHLSDIDAALREIARVLRPGGRLYAKFGPTWFTYNGPHLIKAIGVPWAHLLFSEATLKRVLRHQQRGGRLPAEYVEYKLADFDTMGRLTRRKFRRAVVASGLQIVQCESQSPRTAKRLLATLPLLDELLAGTIVVIAEKPAST